jgi:hypothetical protein
MGVLGLRKGVLLHLYTLEKAVFPFAVSVDKATLSRSTAQLSEKTTEQRPMYPFNASPIARCCGLLLILHRLAAFAMPEEQEDATQRCLFWGADWIAPSSSR